MYIYGYIFPISCVYAYYKFGVIFRQNVNIVLYFFSRHV